MFVKRDKDNICRLWEEDRAKMLGMKLSVENAFIAANEQLRERLTHRTTDWLVVYPPSKISSIPRNRGFNTFTSNFELSSSILASFPRQRPIPKTPFFLNTFVSSQNDVSEFGCYRLWDKRGQGKDLQEPRRLAHRDCWPEALPRPWVYQCGGLLSKRASFAICTASFPAHCSDEILPAIARYRPATKEWTTSTVTQGSVQLSPLPRLSRCDLCLANAKRSRDCYGQLQR